VDNVIEINLVTADGQYLTVNSHQHSDLFWALRGGGGGTFGVVTSVTYQTHPSTTLTIVSYNSSSSNPDTMRKIFKEFIRIHPALSDVGFSGYGTIFNNSLNGIFALSNSSIAKTNQSLNSFFEYAQNLTSKEGPNLTTTTSFTFDSFYNFYDDELASANDVEGTYIEIGSRLVPRKSFENDYERLADLFFELGANWKYVC
jgi:FAD/FMN-containing dehydrogenase